MDTAAPKAIYAGRNDPVSHLIVHGIIPMSYWISMKRRITFSISVIQFP
jgi:hypothetical protein